MTVLFMPKISVIKEKSLKEKLKVNNNIPNSFKKNNYEKNPKNQSDIILYFFNVVSI